MQRDVDMILAVTSICTCFIKSCHKMPTCSTEIAFKNSNRAPIYWALGYVLVSRGLLGSLNKSLTDWAYDLLILRRDPITIFFFFENSDFGTSLTI